MGNDRSEVWYQNALVVPRGVRCCGGGEPGASRMLPKQPVPLEWRGKLRWYLLQTLWRKTLDKVVYHSSLTVSMQHIEDK